MKSAEPPNFTIDLDTPLNVSIGVKGAAGQAGFRVVLKNVNHKSICWPLIEHILQEAPDSVLVAVHDTAAVPAPVRGKLGPKSGQTKKIKKGPATMLCRLEACKKRFSRRRNVGDRAAQYCCDAHYNQDVFHDLVEHREKILQLSDDGKTLESIAKSLKVPKPLFMEWASHNLSEVRGIRQQSAGQLTNVQPVMN